jgi:hypothetical protein
MEEITLFELTEEIDGLFYNKSKEEKLRNALVIIGAVLVNTSEYDHKQLLKWAKKDYEEFLQQLEKENHEQN